MPKGKQSEVFEVEADARAKRTDPKKQFVFSIERGGKTYYTVCPNATLARLSVGRYLGDKVVNLTPVEQSPADRALKAVSKLSKEDQAALLAMLQGAAA